MLYAVQVEKQYYEFNHPRSNLFCNKSDFNVGSETHNIAFQLIWEQCCKTKNPFSHYLFKSNFIQNLDF